jgi:antitoxin HigA-1
MEVNMVRIPTHREPTHPGEMLLEEFLIPMGITQRELAEEIHVSYQRINEIINKRRGMTPSTALRLAKFFGVSEDFWMNLQVRWDIYKARLNEAKELKTIRTLRMNGSLVHS